jgi:preprotein translocase subunit SecE
VQCLQEQKLHDDEEQTEASGPARAQEVLPVLPEAHHSQGNALGGAGMIEKIKHFFSETRVEMRKVTWPTRDELKESTKIVIAATFVVTIFIGIVDQILSLLVKRLLGW